MLDTGVVQAFVGDDVGDVRTTEGHGHSLSADLAATGRVDRPIAPSDI
jgi:hypothetical protein